MKISLENMGGCRRRVKGEIPSDQVRKKEEGVLLSFQKSARLPGFRPGHAPLEMVRRRYANDIEKELRENLLRDGLRHAVETEKLHLVDDPAVEEANFEKDKKFKFILRVDLAPEFKLPASKGLKIPKKSPEAVTDTDITAALARLAEPMAHFHSIPSRPAPPKKAISPSSTSKAPVVVKRSSSSPPTRAKSPKPKNFGSGSSPTPSSPDSFPPSLE